MKEAMDSKTLFTKISPIRLFFIALVPGAVSMLASALYQVIDGILVGQILGELAFAALNLAMPFVIDQNYLLVLESFFQKFFNKSCFSSSEKT